MQKDVLYIDVDDDITAIIGKVKAAKHKIVAIVPPKRTGVLQSAVNLRLLARSAEQGEKKLVLITNNSALSALAAAASIPIAKNLQSRPELAEIPALEVDDGDDVIDGANLPIGELEKTADTPKAPSVTPVASAKPLTPVAASKTKSKAKVPNFDTFRKKAVLIACGVVLLIIFLIWALIYAPRATVLVTARTTNAAVSDKVTLGENLTTVFAASTIKSDAKEIKQEYSAQFDATGKKDVGEKAKGTVKLSKLTQDDYGVPAGTAITYSGYTYYTDTAIVIPKSVPCFPTYCAQSATVGVTAKASGVQYNGASGEAGAPSSINASFVGSTTGGTDKTITIVTASDVDAAKEKAKASAKSEELKKQLIAQFGKDYVVIDSSFTVNYDALHATPAADGEATSGKAMLTGVVAYRLSAVSKGQLKTYLDARLNKEIDGKANRHVYDSGSKTVSFTNIGAAEKGYAATLSTNGKIGPKINESEVKKAVKGKRYGEVQAQLEAIDGVDNVDIKFSPFWVSSVPNDEKKIQIEFKINE